MPKLSGDCLDGPITLLAHPATQDVTNIALLLQVLSGLAASVALVAANGAQALSPVDLLDKREAVAKGLYNTYEARDKYLPQDVRDGSALAKGDINYTKNRVKESETRIDAELEPVIKKNYW